MTPNEAKQRYEEAMASGYKSIGGRDEARPRHRDPLSAAPARFQMPVQIRRPEQGAVDKGDNL